MKRTELLLTSIGTYNPTFFKMHLEYGDNLENISEYNDEISASFIHEYIHYLQDITTTFGYANISIVVDYLKYAINKVRNDSSKSFNPPVVPIKSTNDNVYYNHELKKIYMGTRCHIDKANVIGLHKNGNSIMLPTGIQIINSIIVDYETFLNQKKKYSFGAYAIQESMAYIIESTLYPNVLSKAPELPYSLAEKIAEYIYPQILENRLNILALCDFSLLMYHPADIFFDNLQRMKKDNYKPHSPIEIYHYCYSKLQIDFNGCKTLEEFITLNCKTASDQLQSYFTTSIFNDNKKWIKYLFTNALEFRITRPFFILEIVAAGKLQNNKILKELLNKLGTPMITNIHNEGFILDMGSHKMNISPEYLWVIYQIYKLFLTDIELFKGCELYKYCEISCIHNKIPIYVSSRCDKPWTRVDDNELCPFAIMWKTWELENEIPE